MPMPSEFVPPRAPMLRMHNIPEAERECARALSDNLRDLEQSCSDLSHSLGLFDFCALSVAREREQGKPGPSSEAVWISWQFMASRYGGLSIRNWGQALAAIQRLVGKAPSLTDQMDATALRDIKKDFDIRFPNIDKLRHSIAHPEFYANPKKNMAAENVTFSLEGVQLEGVQSLTMKSNLFGRTFAATFDRIAVTYELSAESALALVDLTKRTFAAFPPESAF